VDGNLGSGVVANLEEQMLQALKKTTRSISGSLVAKIQKVPEISRNP
jgi:hypothetical protein